MLEPIKTQTKTDCIRIINSLLHSEEGNSEDSQLTQLAKENFSNSTDYRVVYKNFNYKKSYDTLIYEGNDKDKIVGWKYLQSYPYETPQFKVGDYIHWNFNHLNLSTWILISLDTQYLYNVKGRMLECNNSLRWKDIKEVKHCYPCVIKDALTYTNLKWGNKGVVEPGGDIVVIVQQNNDTRKIRVNDRFLFDDEAFKVKQIFKEINKGYLELYMMKTPELDSDDFDNDVAANEEPKDIINLVGDVLTPDIKEIMLGENIDFSIYNYISGIKQIDTYTISVSDVPKKYFDLTIVDGNNFKIKNIIEYRIKPLEIKCVNNVNGNILIKQVWLGGNW